MRTEKTAARAAARARIAGLDAATKMAASDALCRVLQADPRIASARCVMAFAPMVDEPDITPLLQSLLARGVTVAMPKLDWASGSLIPVRLLNLQQDLIMLVVSDQLAVRVPAEHLPSVPTADIDVVLVPGLAFDSSGGRVGRGKGFYDHFLPTLRADAFTCATCFATQIIRTVPMEPHDVPLKAVASEGGVLTACRSAADAKDT